MSTTAIKGDRALQMAPLFPTIDFEGPFLGGPASRAVTAAFAATPRSAAAGAAAANLPDLPPWTSGNALEALHHEPSVSGPLASLRLEAKRDAAKAESGVAVANDLVSAAVASHQEASIKQLALAERTLATRLARACVVGIVRRCPGAAGLSPEAVTTALKPLLIAGGTTPPETGEGRNAKEAAMEARTALEHYVIAQRAHSSAFLHLACCELESLTAASVGEPVEKRLATLRVTMVRGRPARLRRPCTLQCVASTATYARK